MTASCKCVMPPEISEYMAIVRSAEYPVCKDQVLFCDLVEKSFREDDIYIDYERLRKYLAYEKYFPFKLFPWEKCVFVLHCCTFWTADNTPRWSDLFLYLARGTGKNAYLAFEDFCLITPANGIKNYDIDLCATAQEQAKRSFDDIHNILENNPRYFEKFFYWNSEIIRNKKTNSALRYRTSNAKTKDGGRPGKVDYDEVHAYENYAQIEVFESGKGKVPHARSTIATTEGRVRGGPLDDYKKIANQVLNGEIADNGFLPFMCHLESMGEIDDPNCWHKANPSLRYLPELQKIYHQQYQKYKLSPMSTLDFVIKRCNLVNDTSETPAVKWENILTCNKPVPDLTGRSCVAGIDYAKTSDFVSAGLLFLVENEYYWITHTWVCTQSADLQRIKPPLRDWETLGFLTFVDAPEISPDIPAEWLEAQAAKYNIVKVGIDLYRYTLLTKALRDHGFDADKNGADNIKLIRKSNQMLNAPKIDSAFVNHRVSWGDHPLMRWFTNNTCIKTNKDGNITYEKIEPKSRKTDGFMAFVSAFCVSDELEDCYDDEDFDIEVIGF